jgi:hypothetical protein
MINSKVRGLDEFRRLRDCYGREGGCWWFLRLERVVVNVAQMQRVWYLRTPVIRKLAAVAMYMRVQAIAHELKVGSMASKRAM